MYFKPAAVTVFFLFTTQVVSAIPVAETLNSLSVSYTNLTSSTSSLPASSSTSNSVTKYDPEPLTHDSSTPLTQDEYFEYTNRFLTAFMKPNNQIQARKINSTFFTENSKGRVSVTRDFVGVELNTEYIFGLFSGITQVDFLMIGITQSYTITNHVAYNNVVSTSSIVNFNVAAINFTIPVQLDLWYTLVVEDGIVKMKEYDAIFRNFERSFALTNAAVKKGLRAKYPTAPMSDDQLYKNAAIESICKVHQQYCNGTNQQYSSYSACYLYLQEKRIGEDYEGGRDTIFCRNIHQVMLPFRPSVHCSHVGPSGGDMCTDSDTNYENVIGSYKTYFGDSFLHK